MKRLFLLIILLPILLLGAGIDNDFEMQIEQYFESPIPIGKDCDSCLFATQEYGGKFPDFIEVINGIVYVFEFNKLKAFDKTGKLVNIRDFKSKEDYYDGFRYAPHMGVLIKDTFLRNDTLCIYGEYNLQNYVMMLDKTGKVIKEIPIRFDRLDFPKVPHNAAGLHISPLNDGYFGRSEGDYMYSVYAPNGDFVFGIFILNPDWVKRNGKKTYSDIVTKANEIGWNVKWSDDFALCFDNGLFLFHEKNSIFIGQPLWCIEDDCEGKLVLKVDAGGPSQIASYTGTDNKGRWYFTNSFIRFDPNEARIGVLNYTYDAIPAWLSTRKFCHDSDGNIYLLKYNLNFWKDKEHYQELKVNGIDSGFVQVYKVPETAFRTFNQEEIKVYYNQKWQEKRRK